MATNAMTGALLATARTRTSSPPRSVASRSRTPCRKRRGDSLCAQPLRQSAISNAPCSTRWQVWGLNPTPSRRGGGWHPAGRTVYVYCFVPTVWRLLVRNKAADIIQTPRSSHSHDLHTQHTSRRCINRTVPGSWFDGAWTRRPTAHTHLTRTSPDSYARRRERDPLRVRLALRFGLRLRAHGISFCALQV